jgi:hypothetical protein
LDGSSIFDRGGWKFTNFYKKFSDKILVGTVSIGGGEGIFLVIWEINHHGYSVKGCRARLRIDFCGKNGINLAIDRG